MNDHEAAFKVMHTKIIDAMDEFEKGTGIRIEDVSLNRIDITGVEDVTKRLARVIRITLAPKELGWK